MLELQTIQHSNYQTFKLSAQTIKQKHVRASNYSTFKLSIILPRPVYASVKGESDKSVTSRLETSPNGRRTGTHEINCNVGGPNRLRKSCRLRREVWPIDSSREKCGAEKLHLPRWAHENRGANESSQVNISKRFQVKISNIYTKPEIIF